MSSRWRAVARIMWAFGLLCIGTGALSQVPSAPVASTAFQAALQRSDFAAIETGYASFRASGQRTPRGTFAIHSYVDFTDLQVCARYVMPIGGTLEALKVARAGCWAASEALLERWRSAYPASELPVLGLSDILNVHQGSSVPAAADPTHGAQRRLEQIQALLESVAPANRSALWYARAIDIATQQGWGSKRFGRLVDEATTRFPDDPKIYRQAVAYYLPENGGSAQDLERLARMAVERNRDRDAPSMYAHVYDEVMLGRGRMWQRAYAETDIDWLRMRTGLQQIVDRFPDPWNVNRLAQHACLARDFPVLVSMLAKTSDHPAPPEGHDGWAVGEEKRCRELAARHRAEQKRATSPKPLTASFDPQSPRT